MLVKVKASLLTTDFSNVLNGDYELDLTETTLTPIFDARYNNDKYIQGKVASQKGISRPRLRKNIYISIFYFIFKYQLLYYVWTIVVLVSSIVSKVR